MKTLEGQYHSMWICCTLFSTLLWLPLKGYRKCPSIGLIASYLSRISFQWSLAGRRRYLDWRKNLRWDTGHRRALHTKHKTQGSTHISEGLQHTNKKVSLEPEAELMHVQCSNAKSTDISYIKSWNFTVIWRLVWSSDVWAYLCRRSHYRHILVYRNNCVHQPYWSKERFRHKYSVHAHIHHALKTQGESVSVRFCTLSSNFLHVLHLPCCRFSQR